MERSVPMKFGTVNEHGHPTLASCRCPCTDSSTLHLHLRAYGWTLLNSASKVIQWTRLQTNLSQMFYLHVHLLCHQNGNTALSLFVVLYQYLRTWSNFTNFRCYTTVFNPPTYMWLILHLVKPPLVQKASEFFEVLKDASQQDAAPLEAASPPNKWL